jgi:hypothetical protein
VKKILYCLGLLLTLGWVVACGDSSKASSEIEGSRASLDNSDLALSHQTTLFQTILKRDSGMARGISLGEVFADAVKKETATPAEVREVNQKNFTEHFDETDLNFVDITYTGDTEGKISVINLDVYIEKQAIVDSLFHEFGTYFTKKYGTGTSENKKTLWALPNNYSLQLENVSTQKDPGFKILFSNKDKKPL